MKQLSSDQYKEQFDIDINIINIGSSEPKDQAAEKKYEKALEYALETRKFEIELYWERAKYFWAFIAASFAVYGVVQKLNVNEKDFLLIIISSIGLVFSLGWYCVNRGSKMWQENWEYHVALLEDHSIGPLFKTIIHSSIRPQNNDDGNKIKKFFNCIKVSKIKSCLIGPYQFSVSKINQIISLYIVTVWLLLLLKHIFSIRNINPILPAIHAIFFCFLILYWGRSSFSQSETTELTAKQFSIKIMDGTDS